MMNTTFNCPHPCLESFLQKFGNAKLALLCEPASATDKLIQEMAYALEVACNYLLEDGDITLAEHVYHNFGIIDPFGRLLRKLLPIHDTPCLSPDELADLMTLRCGAIIERGLALPEARYAMPSYDAETLPEGSVRVIKFHCMGDVEDFYKASLMDADSTQDGNLIYEAIAQLHEQVDDSIPNCKIAQLFPHPDRIHPRELYRLANDSQEARKRWAAANF